MMRYAGLMAAGLLAYLPAIGLAEDSLAQDQKWREPMSWMCRYEISANSIWVIRCLDVSQIDRSDPLTGDGSSLVEKVVPIYGPPYEDSHADELVHSVLCARGNACEIHLAALQTRFQQFPPE